MLKGRYLFILFLGFFLISFVSATEYENRVHADFVSISLDNQESAQGTINEVNDSYRTTFYSFLDDMSLFKTNFTIPNYNSSKTYDFVMDMRSDDDYYSDSSVYCGDSCAGLDVCIFNYTSNSYQHWFCESTTIDGDTRTIDSDFIDENGNFSVVSTGDLIASPSTQMWIYDLYITYNDTSNPKEIFSFNNTLITTENLDFDVSSANYTKYLKIFRTATVSFAKMMFDSYQYLSSWTKPFLEIGEDDSSVEWDYPTRNYSNEQANTYSSNADYAGGGGCGVDDTNFYDDDWTTGHTSCWLVVLDNVTNSDIFTITQDANYTKESISPTSIDYKSGYNFESNNDWAVTVNCFNSSNVWEQFGSDNRQPICGSSPCNRTYTIPESCWGGSLIQIRNLINFTPQSGQEGSSYHQVFLDRELIYNNPQLQVSNEITDQLNSSINTALNSGDCDCVGCSIEDDYCLIPFHFNSSTDGGLTYDSFEVFYSSTPYFNLNTTLISPSNLTYSTNLTQDFQCNITDTTTFDVDNQTILKNATLKVYNSSNIQVYSESKNIIGISNLTNFTHTFTDDDTYLWSCESFNNWSYFNISESNFTLTIDTTNPSISLLNTSENNSQYDKNSIFVNVSVSETNFKNITYFLYNSSTLQKNTTYEVLTTSNTFTSLSLGNYSYNVTTCDLADNCNSTGTYNVSLNNPLINITTPKDGGTLAGNTVGITYNFSTGVISANYTITVQSSGAIEGILNKVALDLSKNTEIFAVTVFDTYILTVDAVDSNGFSSQENVTFTTQQPAGVTSGGGGGGSPSQIEVVAVILPDGFKTLTDLKRAIIYARIFAIEGKISSSDKEELITNLTKESILLTLEELDSLINQIKNDKIENVLVSESIAGRYSLVKTVLVTEFQVTPRIMSGDTSFVCAIEGGEVKQFKRPIKANKLFESCEVIGGNWGCEVSEDKTTAFITYDIKEPDFFLQTLEGEIRYVSQDGEVDRTRVISLNLVNYCAEIGDTGIRIIWVIIFVVVVLGIGGFLIYKKRKLVKQKFLKLFRRKK